MVKQLMGKPRLFTVYEVTNLKKCNDVTVYYGNRQVLENHEHNIKPSKQARHKSAKSIQEEPTVLQKLSKGFVNVIKTMLKQYYKFFIVFVVSYFSSCLWSVGLVKAF